MWLTDGQFDRLVNRGVADADWRWTFGEWLNQTGCRALCVAFSHHATPDQCDKPEHDFCVYCMKPMPYLADRS